MIGSIDSVGEAILATTTMLIAGGVFLALMRSRERRARLQVLEKALHSGQLDEETKRSLASSISGDPRRSRPEWLTSLYQGIVYLCRHSIFVCGWVGIFAGVAMMLIGGPDVFAGGVVTALVSFGIVTVPLALRELEARRGT